MDFKQGDIVQVKGLTTFDFCGTVCGLATTSQPILGSGYIIELAQPLIDYPYSHVLAYSSYMKKVDHIIINPDLQIFNL